MAYSQKVVDHYENPRNVGSFEKSDESVGTGMVGAPACGDVMKLHQGEPSPASSRRALQDLRLWLHDRLQLARHRVGERQDADQAAGSRTQIAEELALPPVNPLLIL
jgi:nitrogen fixation NifU-like protein